MESLSTAESVSEHMRLIGGFLESISDRDRHGNVLVFGDVCVRMKKSDIEYCIYLGRPFRAGSASKFGRFIGEGGKTTCKLSSVLFVASMDSESDVLALREVKDLIRALYEGNKKELS